jgi:hypothetical protein
VNWFGDGIRVGGEEGSPVVSQYINSIIFNGGAVEYSGGTGIWLGRGIESISFRGVHVEKSRRTGVYIGHGARNVAFRDAKLHENSSAGAEIIVGETEAWNVTLENLYFSNVGRTGVYIGPKASDVRLDQLAFGAKTSGAGTAIFNESDTAANNHLGAHIRFDARRDARGAARAFATDIAGTGGFWRDASVAYKTIAGAGEINLSAREATVFMIEAPSATVIQAIAPAWPGRQITLVFKNKNATVKNTSAPAPGGIRLRDEKDFSSAENAVLCLVQTGDGEWIETGR